jgi:glutathione S-transferase
MQPIKVHVIRKLLNYRCFVTAYSLAPAAGPNPWKPILILEELGLPYEINSFSFEVVKQKPFTDLNPNGRAPGISPLR